MKLFAKAASVALIAFACLPAQATQKTPAQIKSEAAAVFVPNGTKAIQPADVLRSVVDIADSMGGLTAMNTWSAIQTFQTMPVFSAASGCYIKANGASPATCEAISVGVLPSPTPTSRGGVMATSRPTSSFVTGINTTNGSLTFSRPACADLSNAASSCSTDTTSASNISSGTLAAARGGAGTINGALKANGSGVVSQAACADLSNGAASCSTDTTNPANITFAPGGTGSSNRSVDAKWRDLPISVKDYGAACNSNGTTGNGADDATAFNNALAAAVSSGRPLLIPPGICRIGSVLTTLTAGVKIIGSGEDLTTSATNDTALVPTARGSWLYLDHTGKGLAVENNPAALAQTNSVVIENIGFLRNQPTYINGVLGSWTPTANDWTLWFHDVDVKLDRLLDFNSTRFISHDIGRFEALHIRSGAHTAGVQLTHNYDSAVLDDVRVWPFGSGPYTAVRQWRLANLDGVIFGRVDAPRVSNVQCTWCRSMYRFTQDAASGSFPQGTVTNGLFSNSYADGDTTPIRVDSGIVNTLQAQFIGASLSTPSIAFAGTLTTYCMDIQGAVHFDFNNVVCNGANYSMVNFNSSGYINICGLRTEGGWNLANTGAPGFNLASAVSNVKLCSPPLIISPTFAAPLGGGAGYTPGGSNFDVGTGDVVTLTCSAAFATPGDSSLTCTPTGTWWVKEGRVYYDIKIVIVTNAYTTASGALNITTNLPAPKYAPAPLSLYNSSSITYAVGVNLGAQLTAGSIIQGMATTSNAAAATMGTAYFPASKTITMNFTGSYQSY